MEMVTSINFDFDFLSNQIKKITNEFLEENLEDAEKQLKKNIKNFKGTPISEANKDVRILRNRTTFKPLIDSGKLLKSIKKTKKGISFKEYGLYQDEGYTIKSKHGFYAPSNKSGIRKKLFKVGGKKVPARPWIYYNPSKKAYNLFFNKMMKKLRTVKRVVSSKKLSF